MTRARIEHTFNCNADTFWDKIFFDEEYNRRVYLDALGFESWKVERLDASADRIVRVVDVVPKMVDLPGPLKKLAEKGIGYRETATFDKKTKVLRSEAEPESMKGKIFINGEIRVEQSGDARCRRIFDVNIEAKIFGVGGMIEKRILSDLQDSYDKASVFTNKFIAEKGL